MILKRAIFILVVLVISAIQIAEVSETVAWIFLGVTVFLLGLYVNSTPKKPKDGRRVGD